MTAWLVSEDTRLLVRMDQIAAVGMLAVDQKWAQVVVGTGIIHGSQGMVALTCSRQDVLYARVQLMGFIAGALAKFNPAGGPVYVHAIYKKWPRRRPDPIWRVTQTIPGYEPISR
ncbi:hypothetical protein [Planobispora longispora]|nr:hypothetical protein [Planobispora longispora]